MKTNKTASSRLLASAFVGVAMLSAATQAAPAQRFADAVWANGDLYDVVVTDTRFSNPPEHSTDAIFSFMNSGLAGQRSVSEAAPGDRDYNGGRWHVYTVAYTAAGLAEFDPDGDLTTNQELTSAEEVLAYAEAGLLEINDAMFYFECPLRPRKAGR